MRIATMVRGYIPAPRPTDLVYAPIDLAVEITERLTRRGHQVDFFGPNGTHLDASAIETLNLRPLAHNVTEFRQLLENPDLMTHYVPGLWDSFLVREMFERAQRGEYDLLHFHHPETALPYVHLYPNVKVVYTLHESLSPLYREVLEMFMSDNQYYVSLSDNQRINAPDLPYVETIYNGVDTKLFEFSAEREDYLLFAGRIVREKGVYEAIKVAQLTDSRLFIIGPTYPDQQDYFDQYIKPHLDDKIVYLGFMPHEDLPRYFQKAKAFLMPIQWEEPFGMTMAESMSSGTPVLAFNRGSASEVVKDGVSGYVVNNIAEMVEALGKVDAIDPKACHDYAVERFSFDKMVDGYEATFKRIIDMELSHTK